MRSRSNAALDIALVAWGIFVGPLCWMLRDGLGPDAADSNGGVALARFLMTFYWGPVLAVLVTLRLALSGGRRPCLDRRRMG